MASFFRRERLKRLLLSSSSTISVEFTILSNCAECLSTNSVERKRAVTPDLVWKCTHVDIITIDAFKSCSSGLYPLTFWVWQGLHESVSEAHSGRWNRFKFMYLRRSKIVWVLIWSRIAVPTSAPPTAPGWPGSKASSNNAHLIMSVNSSNSNGLLEPDAEPLAFASTWSAVARASTELLSTYTITPARSVEWW